VKIGTLDRNLKAAEDKTMCYRLVKIIIPRVPKYKLIISSVEQKQEVVC